MQKEERRVQLTKDEIAYIQALEQKALVYETAARTVREVLVDYLRHLLASRGINGQWAMKLNGNALELTPVKQAQETFCSEPRRS